VAPVGVVRHRLIGNVVCPRVIAEDIPDKGSVASAAEWGGTTDLGARGASLRSTEQGPEQPSLPVQVAPGDPEYLPFPNHVRRLYLWFSENPI